MSGILFQLDVSGAGDGVVDIKAISPSNDVFDIPALYSPGSYTGNFCPSEPGFSLLLLLRS